MDREKLEVRFLLREDLYREIQNEAEDCDVPMASYIKAHIKDWWKKCQKKKK